MKRFLAIAGLLISSTAFCNESSKVASQPIVRALLATSTTHYNATVDHVDIDDRAVDQKVVGYHFYNVNIELKNSVGKQIHCEAVAGIPTSKYKGPRSDAFPEINPDHYCHLVAKN